MAINVDTQDLENYPGTVKRVTIDQTSLVPQGNEGDESYVLSFSTTAYSDNDARTAIQTLYVTNFKSGWCRSSGFAGTANKFSLTASGNTIGIKLDNTVSGTSGSGYYDIVLDYNTNGTPVPGETVAADMEEKIRALASSLNTADTGFRLAYMNSSVEYMDGRFWIISGSMEDYYTGSNRSSVAVAPGSSNDASSILGFDVYTSSEDMAAIAVTEAMLTSSLTASGTSMTINQSIGAVEGDCLMITDRTNTDYFQLTADPVGGTALTCTAGVIKNSYTANEAKVQLLREKDPFSDPYLWHDTIDSITRFGLKTIINQIDYSS
jgi:hypothetical protein